MAALPYIQLYVADYLADTAHLSTVEHGAYLLLMFNYWQKGESFKAKDEQTLNKRLATVARMSEQEWNDSKETLAEFFDVTPTEWFHNRIEIELSAVLSKSTKAKAAGKASASKRTQKKQQNDSESPADVGQETKSSSTDGQQTLDQTLNHTDTDTDTEADTDNVCFINGAESENIGTPVGNLAKALRERNISVMPHNPDLVVALQTYGADVVIAAADMANHKNPNREYSMGYLMGILKNQSEPTAYRQVPSKSKPSIKDVPVHDDSGPVSGRI